MIIAPASAKFRVQFNWIFVVVVLVVSFPSFHFCFRFGRGSFFYNTMLNGIFLFWINEMIAKIRKMW